MRLTCQGCKVDLRPSDVDIDGLVARCHACGWAFGSKGSAYRRQASHLANESSANPPADGDARRRLPTPAAVDLFEDEATLSLSIDARHFLGGYRFGAALVPPVGFTIGVLWLLAYGSSPVGFLVIVASVVVFADWWLARSPTRIFVGDGSLIVRRPRWRRGTSTLSLGVIRQLYVWQARVNSPSYGLRAVTRDDQDILLLDGLHSALTALFLEQAIELHVGLVNEVVAGAGTHG